LVNTNRQGVLDEWINRDDLAKQLELTTDTLARWATDGTGPARIKVGRRVFYRKSSVEKWLKALEMGGDGR
jgi:predicted DNA-binding transcriptional regulator AlpA